MQELRAESKKCTFKLAELSKLYQNVLEQLGIDTDTRLHNTDFKKRLLIACPDFEAKERSFNHSQRRYV